MTLTTLRQHLAAASRDLSYCDFLRRCGVETWEFKQVLDRASRKQQAARRLLEILSRKGER